MKPINDDIRKREMAKAGFFTLIPMLMAAVLVWSGMKNKMTNDSSCNEKMEEMQSELDESKSLVNFIISIQDTVQKMVAYRKDLENQYYEAVKRDSSEAFPQEVALSTYEKTIKNYLDEELSKVHNHNNGLIVKEIITQYKGEIDLRNDKWRKGSNNLDVAELEETNKRLEKENERMRIESSGAAPEISNLKAEKERLQAERDDLKDDLAERKRSEKDFLRDLKNKLILSGCNASGVNRNKEFKKCYGGRIESAGSSLEARLANF